jgi:uncharacterized membrane protein
MPTTSTKDAPSSSNNNKSSNHIGSYITYKFDSLFAHGLVFIIPLLITITAFTVLITSVIFYFTGHMDNYPDALWGAFTRVLDPCAAAEDEGVKNRTVSGIVILIGLVIIAILIGTIATFMDEKLGDLKKGHTTVIEKNHTSKIYLLNIKTFLLFFVL